MNVHSTKMVCWRGPLTSSLAALVLVVMLTGCTAFDPSRSYDAVVMSPGTFSLYNETAPKQPDRWWTVLNADELNTLMERGLTDNLTLKQYEARTRQALARMRQAGAADLPDLTYNGSANRSKSRVSGETQNSQSNYSVGIASAYELDLWGKIRSRKASAKVNTQASQADLEAMQLSIAGQIAETWLQIIEQNYLLSLYSRQLKVNKEQLQLIEFRYKKGRAALLDVFQQRQIVARTETLIPPATSRRQVLVHTLELLMGVAPGTAPPIATVALPNLPLLPNAGVPSDLLARRPDVRAQGFRLRSADWLVSAAQADRLPSIRLTGSLQFGTDMIVDMFKDWVATLAASVTGPIVDGGFRRQEVERLRAVADERLAGYKQTVLEAFKEVEDAISREKLQWDLIKARESELDAARRALEQAEQRYRKGISDYLPVLTAQLSIQGLERQLVTHRRELISYRIALYRALAGKIPEQRDKGE